MANKACPLCRKKTKCLDSRPCEDFVRRRYECVGGHRYTTVEVLVGEDARRYQGTIETWKQRFRDEGKEQMRAELKSLLA